MTKLQWCCTFGVVAISSLGTSVLVAQAGDPLVAIQQKLSSQFKVTTITADRSDIVTAGDVVAIHKPGLMMYAVASPLPPSNTYKNGKIGQGWGGFGKDLMIGISTPGSGTAADYPHRQFVPEEKCWVTGIQVQKDGILFVLYSDAYNDIRYYANLKIPFPNKKEVPSVDAALQMVAEVLTVTPQDQSGNQGSGTAPSPEQSGQQGGFSGQFTNINPRTTERYVFLPDGTFTKYVGSKEGHGQFSVNGSTLTLNYSSSGATQILTIQGDRLIDSLRESLIRTGDAPTSAPVGAANPELGSQQGAFSGQYAAHGAASMRLVFLSNGSFSKVIDNAEFGKGQFSVNGNTLTTVNSRNRLIETFAIQGDRLIETDDHGGMQWDRTGDAPEAPPAAPAPAMQAIAPPPPPSDAVPPPPPTVSLGQTMNQVNAILGQPKNVARVGAKQIFTYSDLRVTFINGKVADVQ